MQVVSLYALTVLIWGSTWFAITFQLGPVAEEVSLVWRFLLASICLFAYAFLRGKPVLLPLREHLFLALQGIGLFGLNYWLVYLATGYVPSALVAVSFSTIVLWNLVNERLFFGTPVESRVVLAALLGLAGIVLIFLPEMHAMRLQGPALYGLLLVLSAIVLSSLGNMAAVRNMRRGLPIVRVNAWGLLYGSLALALLALARGREFTIEWSTGYIGSLVYLGLLGSAAGFGCYLVLIRQIGSARAAYVAVLFPVVALTISTLYEDYTWSVPAVGGLVLVLGGNLLALTGRRSGIEPARAR